MYLRIGQTEIIPERRIIGIFDLDKVCYNRRSQEFLSRAESEGVVLDVSGDIPKSFVVCAEPEGTTVYLSQLSASTLLKRSEHSIDLG